MLNTTNYIVAGGFNFLNVLQKSLENIKKTENIEIDKQAIEKFCETCFSRVLLSFGLGLDKNSETIKNEEKYKESMYKTLNINKLNIKNFKKYLDSGGFQISMGYLKKNKIENFINMYYEFLKDYNESFDYAFTLDIPPNETIFESYEEINDLNIKSYKKLYYNLDQKILDKLIYVYHFRTPKINDIWYNLTFGKDGIFNNINIKNWSVGGIVAGLKGESSIKYITYSLPLTIILKKEIEKNNKEFNFHILGGSTYRDILFYSMIEKIVKEKFNVKINITFDSSGLFKQFLMGRFLDVNLDNNFDIFKLILKSETMFKKNNTLNNYKNIDIVFKIFKMLNEKFNLPMLNYSNIYNHNNILYKSSEIYLCLYLLYFYYQLQQICKKTADELYPLYNSNKKQFDIEIRNIIQKLNRGVLSMKLENKSLSFSKSLSLIENLDEQMSINIINKYLDKDEFSHLVRKIPSF